MKLVKKIFFGFCILVKSALEIMFKKYSPPALAAITLYGSEKSILEIYFVNFATFKDISISCIFILIYFCVSWFCFYWLIFMFKWLIMDMIDGTVLIFRKNFLPKQENKNIITQIENLINYDNAINLIKKSFYGAYKIAEAVKNGTIKETGGYNYIERTGLAAFTGGQIECKKSTADEELENIKQQKIYDDIL